MSIHEIKHQPVHNYIHLPGCGKSLAWRIRRFLRQIRTEIKILVCPPVCICRTEDRRQKTEDRDREGLYSKRGFPTQKWFDQIKVDPQITQITRIK